MTRSDLIKTIAEKVDGVTQEKAKEYFCILDGQHRSKAFAKLNIISGNTYTIPNVHVKEVENIGAYLVDINGVGTSWSQKDRVTVAALTTDDELFTNVAEFKRSDKPCLERRGIHASQRCQNKHRERAKVCHPL